MDVLIGIFTDWMDVVVVTPTEIVVDVVLSLNKLEERCGMLFKRPKGVLRTGSDGMVEVIFEAYEEPMQHNFENVWGESSELEAPSYMRVGRDIQ